MGHLIFSMLILTAIVKPIAELRVGKYFARFTDGCHETVAADHG